MIPFKKALGVKDIKISFQFSTSALARLASPIPFILLILAVLFIIALNVIIYDSPFTCQNGNENIVSETETFPYRTEKKNTKNINEIKLQSVNSAHCCDSKTSVHTEALTIHFMQRNLIQAKNSINFPFLLKFNFKFPSSSSAVRSTHRLSYDTYERMNVYV